MTRQPPRYAGKITTWKDEQGYGYITPNGGGQTVFVHVKSFARQGRRPANGDGVTYCLASNHDGKPRAESVAFVRARTARDRAPAPGPGSGALAATAAFLVFVGAAALAGKLPWFVPVIYLAMSAITYCYYSADKKAAAVDRRRTPEDTLHVLSLAGGWPGALLAQKRLRHKTVKEPFRTTFRMTVLLNCCVLAWLLSPWGAPLRSVLHGTAW